jgi:hypothetical protein
MAEIDDILNTLIAEAYGEGPEGMRRVGETILNRAAIRGLDPVEVIRQPAQYTGYSSPGPLAIQTQSNPTARAAAQAAWELALRPGDPTGGADHYYNPNQVNPGWQNSMQHTGDYGDHTFYSSRTVPPQALAALLTPETRNVPLPRPRPASPMDQIAALFSGSFKGSGQRQDTAAGLGQYIQRNQAKATPSNHMVFGTGINDSFANVGAASKQDLAAALAQIMPSRVAAIDPVGDGPSRSFFEDMFETSLTGVGQPPATRTVQSVPVTPKRAPVATMTTAQARADNGQVAKRPAQVTNDIGRMPAFGDIAALFGATPSAAGSINNQKGQERLTPGTKVIDRSNTPVAVGMGEKRVPVEGEDWTVALPRPRPGSNTSTRVAVTPYTPPPPAAAPMTWAQIRADNGQTRPLAARQAAMTMPTPVSQRPAQARAAMAPPAIAPRQQPLRVVVQAERPKINPANHNIEQLRAALSGRSDYTPAGGGPTMPVYSMNGKLRNTYGDGGNSASGGSLL